MSFFKFLIAGVLSLGLAQAQPIKVPEKIDFTKISAGLNYSHSERSASGKKVGWSGRLNPNGYFYASGIYFGESYDDCSGRGGDAVAVLEEGRREALIKLALKSYNENQATPAAARGAYEQGPQLSVELGEQMGHTTITNFGPDTMKLRSELLLEVQKAFDNPKQRQNGLELTVSLEKETIIFVLTNIGQNLATIMLPDEASSHFSYRKSEDELGSLKYASPPKQKVVKINPKAGFKIALAKPKDFNQTKTLFLYDNLTDVYNDDPALESIPKVQICSRLK
ncbi:MAG: hypothetical protein A2X86_02885 [Bdellovibrionales bacterium GWA2_49_15]|nr:MAG: hypothetical protein A2X86_02885 [Bdellovibrionales bacterium GWA2_49_15]HAZ14115.1 hypothetical protein [Bdellovibrionales bacterium]